ncbi:hypothetical protein [Microcoleus sp. PH2017_30_WIL_O_A]|uniref:hypothetical protein n=1 Tax=Microcoleus sp. PH2017_30_WIL_O_A TaxID=2798840 RepID=UPI001DD725AA|nr:hypothetical protein [Microcoleus sp. PH2017_30_WIL_O_A]MCC3587987.1 hypothetical protein [Microcoleus sp. PH2017_30_WIL_O_A]
MNNTVGNGSSSKYTEITLKLKCLQGTSDVEILNLFSEVEPKELVEMYVWPALRLMWKLRAKEFSGCQDGRKLKEYAQWMRRELRELESLADDYLEEASLTSINAGDYKQLVLSSFEVLKIMAGVGSFDRSVSVSAESRYAEESLSENQMSEEEARLMALKSLQNLSDSF